MSITVLRKEIPIPLYHQLTCTLKEGIDSGKWQPGEQLPNEAKLAEQFGVSKITVRQALRDLAGLGYVRREQGRGTFISHPRVDQGPRELTSFSEEMRRHHLTGSSRILEQCATKAGERAAEALQIRPGDPVFVLKRLRLADAEPMGIQTAYIPLVLVPGILDLDLENTSLYELLQSRYNLQPGRARETYFAVAAPPDAAELMRMDPGHPIFAVERVTYLANGKPFEFVQSSLRGDRYSIILELAADRNPQATREGGSR